MDAGTFKKKIGEKIGKKTNSEVSVWKHKERK